MKYNDLIKNGKYNGHDVTEDELVQMYAFGLILDEDYETHYKEFKAGFKGTKA